VNSYAHGVLLYDVVSAHTEAVVEFFVERGAAKAMIREVRRTSRRWRKICGSRRSSSARRAWRNV